MTRQFRPLAGALAAAALWLAFAGPARAEGEEEGPDAIEKKIKAQMEKVLSLMRESEAKLLEASRGGGKRPDGVDVVPPDGPSMDASPPPPAMDGGTPPPGGEEIRKKIEELLREATGGTGKIPEELASLVRMIPIVSGQGQGEPDPNPEKNSEGEARKGRDLPKPEDGTEGKDPKSAKDSKDPAKEPYESDPKTPPPPGADGDPANPAVVGWFVNLPPETQRRIQSGDLSDVPPAYRAVMRRYLDSLNGRTKGK